MTPETFRRLLLDRVLARLAELDELLGPEAAELEEYAHLIMLRDELQ